MSTSNANDDEKDTTDINIQNLNDNDQNIQSIQCKLCCVYQMKLDKMKLAR